MAAAAHTLMAAQHPGFHMKIAIVLAAALVATGASAADRLPLRDGDYNSVACGPPGRGTGAGDILSSIGLYSGTLSPRGEDRDGYCRIGRVRVEGNVYSGTARCETGGSGGVSPDGTYAFRYRILDETTFVSNGKTYRWCAPHR
ncbi:hypothetical protein [Phreatobacter sp. AB_2022a]|uniref:hypothetical protein n=1 Tax=Phreatobacter sp. AB_2022a TaxID=3003134 RepID=UPI0022872883|nr:hypothetical protein [Phreatobacter sp. AB_2022a]MCZ0735523.1 hypothetical protein [Phreatobacter sp. AB_2022a]